MVRIRTCMTTLAALLVTAPTHAVDWTVGLGAGYAPDYEGSQDHEPVPLWNLRASNLYGATTYVDIFATKLTSNLIAHPNLRLGPMVEFIPERDHVENNAVNDLEKVDPAAMLAGPLGWDFVATQAQAIGIEVQARADVANGHGYLVTPALRLRRSLGSGLSLAGSLSSTYASEDCMSDYFGVDADNAARSGLDQYDADAGFKDAGVDLALGFGQGPGWQAGLVGRYWRLLDDAADSPIVDDEGDDNQLFAGLLVGYRF
jgi:outer membrane protein